MGAVLGKMICVLLAANGIVVANDGVDCNNCLKQAVSSVVTFFKKTPDNEQPLLQPLVNDENKDRLPYEDGKGPPTITFDTIYPPGYHNE